MLKSISAFAALLVASALVLPTVSQADESRSARVSYADLNLASGAGQWTLERRIAGAARSVCVTDDSRELAFGKSNTVCRSAALARARPAFEAAVRAARQGSVTVLDAAALIVTAQ